MFKIILKFIINTIYLLLKEIIMLKHFTLDYWIDDNWYVGRLKEIPNVMSQGETLEELEENIKDAYRMLIEEEEGIQINYPIQSKEIEVAI